MAQTETSADTSRAMGNGGFWGSVVGTVGNLVEGFNYKGQENQVRIAELEAETARANASMNVPGVGAVDKNYIFAAIGVVMLIAAVLIFKKK